MTYQPNSLAAFSDQLADVVEQASRAVVAVHARERLASTGLHIEHGYILTTSATVRREEAIEVTVPSGARVTAQFIGRDAASDLALLKIDDAGLLPSTVLANGDSLRPGHVVMAIARLDGDGPRVAFGAVSSVGRAWRSWKGGEYTRRIQSDLSLYPGFGGSPLVDASGTVHGINSGGLSQQMATTIPGDSVRSVFDQLRTKGHVARGWLGAAMQPVALAGAQSDTPDAEARGLLIVGVAKDGPAATGGLLVGDIVVTLDGRAVRDPHDVLDVLAQRAPGTMVSFELVRGGQRVSVTLAVGARPAGHDRSRGGWSGSRGGAHPASDVMREAFRNAMQGAGYWRGWERRRQ